MKTIILILLIFISPLAYTRNIPYISNDGANIISKTRAYADLLRLGWYTAVITQEEVIYFNANEVTVNKDKSTVTALIRHVPKAEVNENKLINVKEYKELHDCNKKLVKATEFYTYKEYELDDYKFWDYPFTPIKEGSVGEQKHIEACEYLELLD